MLLHANIDPEGSMIARVCSSASSEVGKENPGTN